LDVVARSTAPWQIEDQDAELARLAQGVAVPVIETGFVVGLLVAWAARKARRVGEHLDTATDSALDAGMDRLDTLVRAKLAGHPALRDLDEEVAATAADDPTSPSTAGDPEDRVAVPSGGAVSPLTSEQLELSLRAALGKDDEFAAHLAAALAAVRGAVPSEGPGAWTSMTAVVTGQGRVYQAGRDQHITER
jgi:hypothetical protein